MIIVTGGAGFIGSNIIKALNDNGEDNILVIDDLTEGKKFSNLVDCKFYDYLDKDKFLECVIAGEKFGGVSAIFHQGACTDTTEWDGRYMMENNYQYSKHLLNYSLQHNVQFIYASSAAVYGNSSRFLENPRYELPINVYGYSKLIFDNYVRRIKDKATSQIAGFRYFNVYGPRETHKGRMASVAYHFDQQIVNTNYCKLFAASGGYNDGDQRRDFVFVEDVAKVNLWFYQNPEKNGIFNLGTGRSQSFNDVANAVISWHGSGEVKYIPFPQELEGAYQHFTEADISELRKNGYNHPFKTVEEGVTSYLDIIHAQQKAHEEAVAA